MYRIKPCVSEKPELSTLRPEKLRTRAPTRQRSRGAREGDQRQKHRGEAKHISCVHICLWSFRSVSSGRRASAARAACERRASGFATGARSTRLEPRNAHQHKFGHAWGQLRGVGKMARHPEVGSPTSRPKSASQTSDVNERRRPTDAAEPCRGLVPGRALPGLLRTSPLGCKWRRWHRCAPRPTPADVWARPPRDFGPTARPACSTLNLPRAGPTDVYPEHKRKRSKSASVWEAGTLSHLKLWAEVPGNGHWAERASASAMLPAIRSKGRPCGLYTV